MQEETKEETGAKDLKTKGIIRKEADEERTKKEAFKQK